MQLFRNNSMSACALRCNFIHHFTRSWLCCFLTRLPIETWSERDFKDRSPVYCPVRLVGCIHFFKHAPSKFLLFHIENSNWIQEEWCICSIYWKWSCVQQYIFCAGSLPTLKVVDVFDGTNLRGNSARHCSSASQTNIYHHRSASLPSLSPDLRYKTGMSYFCLNWSLEWQFVRCNLEIINWVDSIIIHRKEFESRQLER